MYLEHKLTEVELLKRRLFLRTPTTSFKYANVCTIKKLNPKVQEISLYFKSYIRCSETTAVIYLFSPPVR